MHRRLRPLLCAGRHSALAAPVRACISPSDANAAADLALYQGTILRALEETETPLIGYARALRANTCSSPQTPAMRPRGSRARALKAASPIFLQVLDAERSRLAAQDRLTQSRTRTATAMMTV